MLSFSDFAKLYGAYERYVQSQTAPTAAPIAPVPTAAPIAPAPTAAPIAPAPTAAPIAPAPTAAPVPTAAPIAIFDALENRVAALENRPPQPSMETPKPATIDDIILGLVGGGENG